MKKKRYTEEQIIGVIKEHEAGAKVDAFAASSAYPMALSTTGAASTRVLK